MFHLPNQVFLLSVLISYAYLGDHQVQPHSRNFDRSRHHKSIYRRSLNQTQIGHENSTSNSFKEIYLGLLLPFTFSRSRSEYKGGAKYYAAAFPLALKSVNDNPYLLPGYKLIYSWNDTKCTDRYNILAMYEQFKSRDRKGLPVHGFIGLGCECDSAAKFASAMQVPLVSHVSQSFEEQAS